jgi:hypothetical protein
MKNKKEWEESNLYSKAKLLYFQSTKREKFRFYSLNIETYYLKAKYLSKENEKWKKSRWDSNLWPTNEQSYISTIELSLERKFGFL